MTLHASPDISPDYSSLIPTHTHSHSLTFGSQHFRIYIYSFTLTHTLRTLMYNFEKVKNPKIHLTQVRQVLRWWIYSQVK